MKGKTNMCSKPTWLVLGEDKDVFIRIDSITFFRKMWSVKKSEHYTRIFLAGDKFPYEEWHVPYEEIKEAILNASE